MRRDIVKREIPFALIPGFLFFLMFALSASYANAAFFIFNQITENGSSSVESQLFVDVTAKGTEQVQFSFRNVGPVESSITDVYFDDGSLLGISSLIDKDDGVGGHSGVDFSRGANPPDLPGGDQIGFHVTAGFLADSDAPVSHNGVNPEEWLGILFNIQNGRSFDDVLSELRGGSIRIGLHVQAIDGGRSESFVNDPTPVPIPAAIWLMAPGLLGLAVLRKKFPN
jgi:hypothetical protein